MDTLYSLSLLGALIAGALGVLLFALVLTSRTLETPTRTLMGFAGLGCGEMALLLGILSVFVHATFGHGAESVEPLRSGPFIMQHKAYWVVLLLVIASNVGWVMSLRKGRDDRRTREGSR